jgi:S-adenosylmethionine synthetase
MQSLILTELDAASQTAQPVEIVERKGIGHPDTVCDALAEELSRALCRFYLERFGLVMHHNVDKVLLWGGTSQPAFGGGKVVAPMEIFLAGRATREYKGVEVPLDELVHESCTNWLRGHFHALNPDRHIKIHSLIRPGSADLVDLYLRQEKTGIALANDTSCGVGYAPLSRLEQIVLQVEKHLNASDIKSVHPEFGEDIKVMGVRRDKAIELTIACAFIDRYVNNTDDYVEKKKQLAIIAEQTAKTYTNDEISISVNAADNIDTGSLYLTVTGTSAESGDDGEVGRGNRVNGLITPYRPMNMEAAAGKNPVTHVGKLYNIIAQQVTESLVTEIDEIREAYCYLVSRIGSPVAEPQVVDLKLIMHDEIPSKTVRSRVEDVIQDKLSNSSQIQRDLVDGLISIY